MAIKHLTIKAPGQTLAAVADWNAAHSGTAPPEVHSITGAAHTSTATSGRMLKADANGLPINATNTDAAVSAAVTATHTQNTDSGTTENTFTIDNDSVTGKITLNVGFGEVNKTLFISNASLTANRTINFPDATGVIALTSQLHTQGTDTTLGAGAVAADHGAAATDEVVNVSYGTGDPPAANTTTEGSLFVKYTA